MPLNELESFTGAVVQQLFGQNTMRMLMDMMTSAMDTGMDMLGTFSSSSSSSSASSAISDSNPIIKMLSDPKIMNLMRLQEMVPGQFATPSSPQGWIKYDSLIY